MPRMATISLVSLCVALFLYLSWRLFARLRYDALAPAKRAHWSAPYAGLWMWWQHVQDRSAEVVHQAHLRHGPVVRLGPSELSVCCVEGGVDAIYSVREVMPKTDWYQVANSYGKQPMVALREEGPHSARKRLLAYPYSTTALRTNQSWLDRQAQITARLESTLKRVTANEPFLDFYDLTFAWSVDFIGEYLFGPDANLHLLDDLSKARCIREDYKRQRVFQFLPLPATLLNHMGYRAEIGWIFDMIRAGCAAAGQEMNTVLDCFTNALAKRRQALGICVSDDDDALASSELQDHMIAGVDTLAMVLAACAWLISLPANQQWQTRLGDELRAAKQPTSAVDLERLPLLDAVTREVLRLHAPVGGSQPRKTPKIVELGPQGYSLTVPGGTTVHSQAHTLHRSSVFENSECFDPGRWLNASSEEQAEMKRWYWPFSSGSRACIGEQLGTDGLKIAIATLYGTYRTEVVAGTSFALSKGTIAMPVDQGGYYLRLHVRPRTQSG